VLQGEEPLASAASMSTKLPPYTHQWVHEEAIHIEKTRKFPGEYVDPEGFSSVIGIPTLKLAVAKVINHNIWSINEKFTDNKIDILRIDDENIVQGDNIILPKGVFELLTKKDITITTVNDSLNYNTCDGPECPGTPNAVAYIQYYVALACKCVSIDRTLKPAQCHATLLNDATNDFKTFVGPTFFDNEPYNSQIEGTVFIVSINADKNGKMKLTDTTSDVITVNLTEYEPTNVRCICLICLYYFMTHVMIDNPNINETNLLKMIKCWKKNDQSLFKPVVPPIKSSAVQLPTLMPRRKLSLVSPQVTPNVLTDALGDSRPPGWSKVDPNVVNEATVASISGGSSKPKVKANVSLNRDIRSRS
jgi:hypothetical protein